MPIGSLRELIDMVTGKILPPDQVEEDYGLAEVLPFPFLGLVGQIEMKLALLLALVNPAIGGVLLIGPRGTGKTTAVRSLLDLLPNVEKSACFYGCVPEDIEIGGADAVCPDCARKYAEGKPLTRIEKAHLVELPLNARLEDVIGGLDERAAMNDRIRLKRGILAQADQNILYVDEVNLLNGEIIDAILDAAALGKFTVRRGPISATYKARFILIGSMNPEEGSLRPQIMDRFGFRVIVRGLDDANDRLEAYQRVHEYLKNPRRVIKQYAEETSLALQEVQETRKRLNAVKLPPEVAKTGIRIIQELKIDSLRAEITLFEAARAYAAADSRSEVTLEDLKAIAPMSLRMRRSPFMDHYFNERANEEVELQNTLNRIIPGSSQQPAIE